MNKNIVFYDGGCGDCQNVAKFFSANGVDYNRKNIKAHPELADTARKQGAKTFPAVFVDDLLIEGWNEKLLRQALDLK
ncbi:MAG: glutaredoxin family protein [Candidatus Omnitrophota bacterium]